MTAAVHQRLRPGLIASLAGVLGVFGPGLLAGLSDDDPAGITIVLVAHSYLVPLRVSYA
jgi:hypothetical protein